MKTNRLLILSALALVMASCGNNDPSYADSSLSSGGSGADTSIPVISVSVSAETVNSFPTDKVDAFKQAHGITATVPSYEATEYFVEGGQGDWGGSYLAISSSFATAAAALAVEDSYKAALEAASYIIDDSLYEYLGYYADDAEETIEIQFFADQEEDGTPYFCVILYSLDDIPEEESTFDESIEYVTEFPTEELAAFCEENGIAVTIPPFEAETYGASSGLDDMGYLVYEVYGNYATLAEAQRVETAYRSTLTTAGFTVDYDDEVGYGIATDEGETVEIYFWADEDEESPYFCIDVYPMNGGGTVWGEETFDQAVPGESSTISFEDESMMVALSTDQGIWNNGAFSFGIDQHESQQTVGNTEANPDGFFSPAVRCYAGQCLSIYSEIAIASISFEFEADKYRAALGEAEFNDGEYNAGVLTLPANTIATAIVLAKQVRLTSITVTFAA